jgi:hypothetical protein
MKSNKTNAAENTSNYSCTKIKPKNARQAQTTS